MLSGRRATSSTMAIILFSSTTLRPPIAPNPGLAFHSTMGASFRSFGEPPSLTITSRVLKVRHALRLPRVLVGRKFVKLFYLSSYTLRRSQMIARAGF
jgi:hypothetical protein